MKTPRFLSLFSGCGGIDLGFIQAGFRPVGAYDVWPLAIENYRKNIGADAHIWDLSRGVLPRKVKCDVVVAGSPCQGFSTVGKRKLNDPRNGLLSAAVKIAVDVAPRVIVFENVPGLLFGKHRRHWDDARHFLESAGYKIASTAINARDVGIPQVRKRLIFIAWRTDVETLPQYPGRPSAGLLHAISMVKKLPNHEPAFIDENSPDFKIATRIQAGQKLSNVRAGVASVHTWEIPEVFGKTNARERALLVRIMKMRRCDRRRNFGDADPVSVGDLTKACGQEVSDEIASLLEKGYLRRIGRRVDLQNTFNGKFRRASGAGSSYTVDTKFGDPRKFLHPVEHRGFSVREAARIQGFPDDYVFHGSRTDQFKLVGNAIPPPMGYAIGKVVRRVLTSR